MGFQASQARVVRPLHLQCPVTQELERAFEAVAGEVQPDISVGRVSAGTLLAAVLTRAACGARPPPPTPPTPPPRPHAHLLSYPFALGDALRLVSRGSVRSVR